MAGLFDTNIVILDLKTYHDLQRKVKVLEDIKAGMEIQKGWKDESLYVQVPMRPLYGMMKELYEQHPEKHLFELNTMNSLDRDSCYIATITAEGKEVLKAAQEEAAKKATEQEKQEDNDEQG
jgi:hypothetical protein